MAAGEIDVLGKLVNRTNGKLIDATQSFHTRKDKSVQELLDELDGKIGSIPVPPKEKNKGKTTLSRLPDDASDDDVYSVFADDNSDPDNDVWSTDSYMYDGEMRLPGTYFVRANNSWVATSIVQDFSMVLKAKEPDNTIFVPTSLRSSVWNTRSGYFNGIPLATLRCYKLNEKGVYEEYKEGSTYSSSSSSTLYVPYARYYKEGGETIYEGGALTAEDYKHLIESKSNTPGNGAITIKQGGSSWTFNVNQATDTTIELEEGGSNIDIDTYFPANPSDNKVPSTKLISDTFSDYVTLSTNQFIEAVKTFENNSFGNLVLWADPGTYAESPAIKFISQTSSTGVGKTIGWMGVQMYPWSTQQGYPAFWTSQGGTPQQIVRVDERGDSTHGVYIDAQGFTKKCTSSEGSSVTIDTAWPETPADDHVPSTSLVLAQFDNYYNRTTCDNYFLSMFGGSQMSINSGREIFNAKTLGGHNENLDIKYTTYALVGILRVPSAPVSSSIPRPQWIDKNNTTHTLAYVDELPDLPLFAKFKFTGNYTGPGVYEYEFQSEDGNRTTDASLTCDASTKLFTLTLDNDDISPAYCDINVTFCTTNLPSHIPYQVIGLTAIGGGKITFYVGRFNTSTGAYTLVDQVTGYSIRFYLTE